MRVLSTRRLCSGSIGIVVGGTSGGGRHRYLRVSDLISRNISLLIISPGSCRTLGNDLRHTHRGGVPVIFFSHAATLGSCATCVNNSGIRTKHGVTRCTILLYHSDIGASKQHPVILRVAKPLTVSPTTRHRTKFDRIVDGGPSVSCHRIPDR